MAPAVLGRESKPSRGVIFAGAAGLSRPLGEAAETTEEILPDTECPGRAVAVLDVSFETSDNGLGMNSSVSENPTLALLPGLPCFGLLSVDTGSGWGAGSGRSSRGAGSRSGTTMGSDGDNKATISARPKPVGLVGALLPRIVEPSNIGGGCRMGKSLVEMAPDMPLRWPLRGGCRLGVMKPLSDLVGLVLMTAIELPSRRRPPTNSLPPLRWPCLAGREGVARAERFLGVAFGEMGGLSMKDAFESEGSEAPGLKLNAGKAFRPGLSKASEDNPNDVLEVSMADIGRRAGEQSMAGDGGCAGKTNGGFGGGNSARGEGCDRRERESETSLMGATR